jgi:hypothetical protein
MLLALSSLHNVDTRKRRFSPDVVASRYAVGPRLHAERGFRDADEFRLSAECMSASATSSYSKGFTKLCARSESIWGI